MSWSFRSCFVQLIVLASTSHASPTNNDECNCYLTNGSNSAYYLRHDFYDFRNLSKYAQVPSPIRNSSRKAGVTSDYFKSDTWDSTWNIQDWNNRGGGGVSLSGDATVFMSNSPNNIYIQENDDDGATSDTFLTMRTMRMPGFQSAAEFESVSTFHYVSVRILARVTGSAGACMALFTYLEDDDELADVQEADIEILTRDPKNRIQYTNQPSYTNDGDEVPKATRNGTLPKGLGWDDWVVHRLDWTPERSVWYVQGQEVASIEFQTPKDPAQIILNAWSDGGSWSGNMSLGDSAYMQIQWIDMVYNATKDNDKRSLHNGMLRRSIERESCLLRREDNDDGCKVVCSIDDVDKTGEAKVLWKSAASHTLVMEHWLKVVVGYVTLMVIW
ncbi:unnamed protein product [Fusarium venenatum]|uniref:GH16 domain-containing protein n=1 Tax=Fusarium venenatum TaxID=56646 RepID=A0A2L2TEA3_9HYPO|nr:uncharacterized protein FVRRES_11378 [Fusarium venenatum]KAH6978080.1 putative xylanase 3 [Fusarium venenatum]CEI38687.1 unnamed protein product [Fusarium venenatum]